MQTINLSVSSEFQICMFFVRNFLCVFLCALGVRRLFFMLENRSEWSFVVAIVRKYIADLVSLDRRLVEDLL